MSFLLITPRVVVGIICSTRCDTFRKYKIVAGIRPCCMKTLVPCSRVAGLRGRASGKLNCWWGSEGQMLTLRPINRWISLISSQLSSSSSVVAMCLEPSTYCASLGSYSFFPPSPPFLFSFVRSFVCSFLPCFHPSIHLFIHLALGSVGFSMWKFTSTLLLNIYN